LQKLFGIALAALCNHANFIVLLFPDFAVLLLLSSLLFCFPPSPPGRVGDDFTLPPLTFTDVTILSDFLQTEAFPLGGKLFALKAVVYPNGTPSAQFFPSQRRNKVSGGGGAGQPSP